MPSWPGVGGYLGKLVTAQTPTSINAPAPASNLTVVILSLQRISPTARSLFGDFLSRKKQSERKGSRTGSGRELVVAGTV